MELRKAVMADLTAIMEIIGQDKAFLKGNGVDQWQSGYPDEACIRQDIEAGKGYVCAEDGGVVGYLCIDFDGESAYNDLRGAWLSEGPYVVVHRLALSDAVKGRGFAALAFRQAEEIARDAGIGSLKVDTDADNRIMKHLLEKNDFTCCGKIVYDSSDKIAFEKLL